MRWSTLIYALFTFFLAIEPGLNALEHIGPKQQLCCNASCKDIPRAQDASESSAPVDACDDTCNPFEVCQSCVLDCLTTGFALSNLGNEVSTHQAISNQSFVSAGYTEFWQPPKCV